MINFKVQKYKQLVSIVVPVTVHLNSAETSWVIIKVFQERKTKTPLLKARIEVPIEEYSEKESEIKKFFNSNSVMNLSTLHLSRWSLPYKTYKFSDFHPSGKTHHCLSVKDTYYHSIDDQPSLIEYDCNGQPVKVIYHDKGQASRPLEKGPADTHYVYDLKGSKIGMNEHFIFGIDKIVKNYRIDPMTPDLPNLMIESYTRNGKYHRTNGPAYVAFDGRKHVHKFYVDGTFIGTDLGLKTEEEIIAYYQNHQLMG